MGLFSKFKDGLKKTRETFFNQIKNVLSSSKLDQESIEELEELLILSDMGIETVNHVIDEFKKRSKDYDNPLTALQEILKEMLRQEEINVEQHTPEVISIVGVNGTGKTTTLGKLAKIYHDEGKTVVLAACDTFRAAAIEQIKEWGKFVGVEVILQKQGADAAAVAYDAVSHAKSKNKDMVFIDTAGRLHTRRNLMEELRKIHRVVSKVVPGAPHEVLLTIDATTGQNGLVQAKKFTEAVNVSGIVLTKLDGTAKGGIVFAIAKELKLPIKFIGVGEKADDLKPFDPGVFVNALLESEDGEVISNGLYSEE
ncbi:MAG: signal recognition particle-docking protein FtsY [Kosmotogaceae bacterium]